MLKDALKTDITSSTTRSEYWRLLILGLTLILLSLGTKVDVKLLGLSADEAKNAVGVLAILLVVPVLQYLRSAWRDWYNWWKVASDPNIPTAPIGPAKYFPEVGMFWGRSPKPPKPVLCDFGNFIAWRKFDDHTNELRSFSAWFSKPTESHFKRELSYEVSFADCRAVRHTICWFVFFDVVLPVLVGLAPLAIWLCTKLLA